MTNPVQPLAVSAICIPTTNADLNGNNQQLVNARDLHAFLGSKQRFADWVKNRIQDYGFNEAEDFFINLGKTPSAFFSGRPKTEYYISLDMAKELAMVERNDKGRQARRYFIDMEKRSLADVKQAIAEQQSWVIDDLQEAYLSARPEDAKLVRYYCCGALSNREIAKLMGINDTTVGRHLRNLNRLGLVRYPRPSDYTKSAEQQTLAFADGGAV